MTPNPLTRIDQRMLIVIRAVGRCADRRGVRAYLVGGIVRDILLGRENLDVDIVVQAPAIAFARGLAGDMGVPLTAYPEFGTATLRGPFGLRLDFVEARQEHYPCPGALPKVRPGTLNDDLFRRDFTINAMAVCLNKNRWGQLVDEFGGLSDLRGRNIRVLHERSFIDDPTRILRAVRFEQRLRFHIEPRTLRLLRQALRLAGSSHQPEAPPPRGTYGCGEEGKNFDNVKPPRYFIEFKKMLAEEQPLVHLTRLKRLGALPVIDSALNTDFRLLARIQGCFKKMPRGLVCNRWLIFLMAVAERMPGKNLDAFLRKFPFRREERESIAQAAGSADILRKLAAPELPRSRVYEILKPLSEDAVVYARLRASGKRAARRMDRYLRHDAGARADINGEDLKRLGVDPGEKMGSILKKVLYMKIDGRAKNRKEQLEAAAALAALAAQ